MQVTGCSQDRSAVQRAYKGVNKNWTKTSNVLLKVTLHVLPTHYKWQCEGESRRRNWNEGKTEIHVLFRQQRSKVFSCLFNILRSEKREETRVADILESTVWRTSQNQRDVLKSAGNGLHEAHKQAHFYLHYFYTGKVCGVERVEECIRAPPPSDWCHKVHISILLGSRHTNGTKECRF